MSSIRLDHLLLVGFQMQDNGVGVLGVGAPDRWQPTDVEMTLAQLVAKQAAVVLDNLRAYHQIERRLGTSQLAVSLLPHELKRKPRAIGGELELLLSGKEGPLTSHQVRILERIQEYVEEHERLIERVLDVQRLDAQVFRARMIVRPILPVLRSALSRLALEIEGTGMQLVTDLALVLPSHRLDPVLVDTIIKNLVRNALQYAWRGGIVRVRAWTTDEGYTFVAVEDEGPGVLPEFRELIFESWHRGPFSPGIAGRPGNLGLGLFFVRKLMELHGGRAEYDNSYSGGARFLLTFPRLEGGHEDDSPRDVDD
jgi:signal transduction histidine kinase